jgi:hypothetical protein
MKFLSLTLIAAATIVSASTIGVDHNVVATKDTVSHVLNGATVADNANNLHAIVLKRKVVADALRRRMARRHWGGYEDENEHDENEHDENERDEDENERDENERDENERDENERDENERDENENEADEEEEDENEANESGLLPKILRRGEADENEVTGDEWNEDEDEEDEEELKRRFWGDEEDEDEHEGDEDEYEGDEDEYEADEHEYKRRSVEEEENTMVEDQAEDEEVVEDEAMIDEVMEGSEDDEVTMSMMKNTRRDLTGGLLGGGLPTDTLLNGSHDDGEDHNGNGLLGGIGI